MSLKNDAAFVCYIFDIHQPLLIIFWDSVYSAKVATSFDSFFVAVCSGFVIYTNGDYD